MEIKGVSMTREEYEIKQLEKELSEKEGTEVKILKKEGNHITVCSLGIYFIMEKLGFIKNNKK